jgi:hypothetical protein
LNTSNGLALISQAYLSLDLGDSWINISSVPSGGNLAIMPDSSMKIVANPNYLGAFISETGYMGTFTLAENKNLYAIEVRHIIKHPKHEIVYLVTGGGEIAYTNAYSNDSIESYDKWNGNNGIFPLFDSLNNRNFQAYTVGLSPWDSLHVVIADANYGFMVSQSGPYGFQSAAYDINSYFTPINEIEFITDTILIAVSGGNKYNNTNNQDSGYIWRSTDAGFSWTAYRPSEFGYANAIGTGYSDNDTVIYIATGNENAGLGYLWKSTDLGITWTKINTIINSGGINLNMYDVCVDSRSNDTLYVVASGGTNNLASWSRSVDGGNTYEEILPFTYAGAAGQAYSVLINDDYPDSVYASFGTNIFCYDALADSTVEILRALPGEYVYDLASGSILAGTTTGFYGIGPIETDIVISEIKDVDMAKSKFAVIYPNPVSGNFFTLKIPDSKGEVKIQIMNTMGQLLNQKIITDGRDEILFEGLKLSSGTYMVKIILQDDYITQKFIFTE